MAGDLINDILVIPEGPIRADTDTASTIVARPGGSAANTASWLASVGVGTDLIAAVGDQDAAHHERDLREHGVQPHLQVESGAGTGTIAIIVEGQHRTMLTSRGANALFDPASVTEELLAAAAHLHVAAYGFLDGFGIDGAQDLIERAHSMGCTVSFNPGSAGFISDSGPHAFLEATAGADLLLSNLAEAQLISGGGEPSTALAALLVHYPAVALTMGASGSLAGSRTGPPRSTVAQSVQVLDSTGAGDAFAAGFLSRWIRDASDLDAALAAATALAARAVTAIGARPPS